MKRGWAHGAPCPGCGRRGALALVCPANRRIHRPMFSERFVQRQPRRSGSSCQVLTRMPCSATLTKLPRPCPAHVMPSGSPTAPLGIPPTGSLPHLVFPCFICLPFPQNSILLNRSGPGSDSIIGLIASLKIMRPSSRLVARLGMPSLDYPLSSLPSAPDPGLI